MMTLKEVEEHLTASPFKAFRIHMTDGKALDVTHPDMVIVTPQKVILGVGPRPHVADHIEHCALVHIVRIEELDKRSRRSRKL